MEPDRDSRPFFLFLLIVLLILAAGLFTPLRERIVFHLDDIKSRIFYVLNDPSAQLFTQQEQPTYDSLQLTGLAETVAAMMPTETPSPSPTITNTPQPDEPTPFPTDTPEPTATEEPLPEQWHIEGVIYETQHGIWNYCAPTNLSMAMTFWGWRGQRTDIGPKVKPFNKDKNVNFYELQDYVINNSDLNALYRPGGTNELLKRLLVNGFPVLVEKGAFMQEVSGKLSWMGHYNLITGYDDSMEEWTVQDSYYTPDYKVSYATFDEEWQSFNHQFMIVYPRNLEGDLYTILGPYTNENWANKTALRMSEEQVEAAETSEEYFYAYFNLGSSRVMMSDFYGAAQAYDMAFYTYYPEIENSRRPYRILWYQTEPYKAYYYSGRYNDVISLAEMALSSTGEPYLEEAHYWRAMAYYHGLEEVEKAKADLDTCLNLHTGFEPCEQLLYEMGY